jgi:SAM-dependent methyltransferase
MLESPLESLNGADAFLRAQVLEEREGFAAARKAFAFADAHLYSAEARDARDACLAHVVELLRAGEGLVLDVATGRGTLLELLLRETARPLGATDVSPTILRRVRERLGDERVEYLAADAHELPFAAGEVPTLVSHLGLANVPSSALRELRRVGRELVATHVFYPDDDAENRAAAREAGLEQLLVRSAALETLADAGWDAAVEAERAVRARPTPESALVPGVRIDGIPVVETTATWCVLRASRASDA